MQKSWSDPEVFDEVIHDGGLDYLSDLYGGETAENLALVLIPGDLVDYGNTYHQWEEDFFARAADLLESVPAYPVMGIHEANTNYFFQYFLQQLQPLPLPRVLGPILLILQSLKSV